MALKPYKKQAWVDHQVDEATSEIVVLGTPVDKIHLDHLEDGIQTADARAIEALGGVEGLQATQHSHSNKGVLDGITSALVIKWNSAVTHIADAVKHITAAERTLWNTVTSKADADEVMSQMGDKANQDWAIEQFNQTMNKVGVFNGAGTLDDARQVNHWYEIASAAGVGGLPPLHTSAYNNSALYVFGQNEAAFTQVLFCLQADYIYFRKFVQWQSPQWSEWFRFATTTPPQELNLPLKLGITGYCYAEKEQFGRATLTANMHYSGFLHSQVLFALPAEVRNHRVEYFGATCVAQGVKSCLVSINANGEVIAWDGSDGATSIIFSASYRIV